MKKIISILLAIFIIISGIFTAMINAFGAEYKTVSGTFNYTYASEVLELVNKERTANGLKALTMTRSLTDGAMLRAAETTVSFSHTRPNGESCFTAFEWTTAAGENIAYGQKSPEQVMQGWMNSSGHRANILNSSFTTIGIGCFEYGGRLYWSQAFSGGKGTAYNPGGSRMATVEVSLKSGVQSTVVSNINTSINTSTTKQITSNTTTKATTKATTRTTAKSTTNATIKTTTKPTAKPSTTKQSNNSSKRSIYDIINSILQRLFK